MSLNQPLKVERGIFNFFSTSLIGNPFFLKVMSTSLYLNHLDITNSLYSPWYDITRIKWFKLICVYFFVGHRLPLLFFLMHEFWDLNYQNLLYQSLLQYL